MQGFKGGKWPPGYDAADMDHFSSVSIEGSKWPPGSNGEGYINNGTTKDNFLAEWPPDREEEYYGKDNNSDGYGPPHTTNKGWPISRDGPEEPYVSPAELARLEGAG